MKHNVLVCDGALYYYVTEFGHHDEDSEFMTKDTQWTGSLIAMDFCCFNICGMCAKLLLSYIKVQPLTAEFGSMASTKICHLLRSLKALIPIHLLYVLWFVTSAPETWL